MERGQLKLAWRLMGDGRPCADSTDCRLFYKTSFSNETDAMACNLRSDANEYIHFGGDCSIADAYLPWEVSVSGIDASK